MVVDRHSIRICVKAAGSRGLLEQDTVLEVPARRKGSKSYQQLVVQTGPRTPDQGLLRLVGRASRWMDDITTGRARSLTAIARRENLSLSYVSNTIELVFLAPDLKQAIVEGRQPPGLTVTALTTAIPLPMSWAAQRRHFGAID